VENAPLRRRVVAVVAALLVSAAVPARANEGGLACLVDDEGILHVKKGTRVRFAYVKPTVDSDGPETAAVRALTSGGQPTHTQEGMVKVVLRQSLRWHAALEAMSVANDRYPSDIVIQLVDATKDALRDRDGLPSDITRERGRPGTDTERTINVVVERDVAMPHAWTADLVGEYVDQSYLFTPSELAKLERLSAAAKLSPGQVVDILVMRALAKLGQRKPRR
jgi:hypothetical protein